MADETSIWKKELSFGRKRKAPKDEAPVEKLVEPDAEFAPKTSCGRRSSRSGARSRPRRRRARGRRRGTAPVAEQLRRRLRRSRRSLPRRAVAPRRSLRRPGCAHASVRERVRRRGARSRAADPAGSRRRSSRCPRPRRTVSRRTRRGQDELRPRPHLVPVETPRAGAAPRRSGACAAGPPGRPACSGSERSRAPARHPPAGAGGRAARGEAREDALLEEGALRLGQAEAPEGAEAEEAEGREAPQAAESAEGRPDAVLEEGLARPQAQAGGDGDGRVLATDVRRSRRSRRGRLSGSRIRRRTQADGRERRRARRRRRSRPSGSASCRSSARRRLRRRRR